MTDSKPSNWERTARVVLPGLSIIAFVVVQLMGKQPMLSWALIALTVFLVVLTYHSEIREKLLSWQNRRDDRLAVEKAYPQFREFVRRFEQFVSGRTNDTLHAIVFQDICQGRTDQYEFRLPHIEIWESMSRYFSERISREPRTMKHFLPALMEFHFIVGSYSSHCVSPIFDSLPATKRAEIKPPVKDKLNLFQQKFSRFAEDYQNFGTILSESRPCLQGLPIYISIPAPMS